MQYIEKAIQLKKELDELRPLTKDDEARIMQKFRLDWNYHSNHLEGNSLTYGETKALILFGLTAQGKPLKDHFEITGHDEAVKWITDVVQQKRPLTESFIRELHTLILKESYETDAITPEGLPTKKRIKVGEYKTTPNHVKTKTGEIFRFATPEETPSMMHDLVKWYRKKTDEKDLNPILLAVEFHYKYIRIHPFDDGNGRTARLLMNFILMQYGYPPVIIKTDDKENYFAALRQADAGILEPFIEYITENLNHSLKLMIKGAKGEGIEESDDLHKEILLLEQRLKALGTPFKELKSNGNISDFYYNSIIPLSKKYESKGELLERFYLENNFHIKSVYEHLDQFYELTETTRVLDENTTSLPKDIHKIEISHFHSVLNHGIPNEISYISLISIKFEKFNIVIENSKDIIIMKKRYDEKLSEAEIDEIINSEIKIHKEFIENKIEELKNTRANA